MASDMEVAASKTATALAEYMGMGPDRIDEVRLAVVEACINAFEHSHAKNRQVYITFAVVGGREPEALEIRVRDEGVGFSPQAVEEPRIADKLKAVRKRGWGLKIIEGLMDEVEIESGDTGTTLVMRKRKEPKR
jgi:serine/threonine-protein kinase RsbW